MNHHEPELTKENKNPHPHLNPLPEGEEINFPPLQGEGQGGDGGDFRVNVIAIDGPVGAGKSTVARALAKRLGYAYLDTGAMYRAIGWKVNTAGIECNDGNLEKLCADTRLVVSRSDNLQRIFVDGKDITEEIRTPEISRMSSVVSSHGPVRRYLVRLQRETGLIWANQHGGVIVEGRDMGTVVFPDARFKFFLDADIAVRGKRRWKEMTDKGIEVGLNETIQSIEDRDANDKGRSIAPLKKADDAAVIDTTGLGLDEVVDRIYRIIQPIIMSQNDR